MLLLAPILLLLLLLLLGLAEEGEGVHHSPAVQHMEGTDAVKRGGRGSGRLGA